MQSVCSESTSSTGGRESTCVVDRTYTRILFMGTGPSTGNAGNNCKDLDTPFTRNLHL